MFTRIVVGVDCREGGRDALALAALLQRAGGGEVVAVHVYRYDRTVSLNDAAAVEAALEQDLLAGLERELVAVGVSARPIVVSNAVPERAIVESAERDQADLIVLGSTHRAGIHRMVAGDVTAAALHRAPCAVAVAPRGFTAGAETELVRIGVGFDGSPEAHAARAVARSLAATSRADVQSITVMQPAAVAQELVDHSGQLDLLVVGCRGFGALGRLVHGSTSTDLVRAPTCPVLVVSLAAARRLGAVEHRAPAPAG